MGFLLKKYDTSQRLQNVRRRDEHMSNKHVIRHIYVFINVDHIPTPYIAIAYIMSVSKLE